MSFTYYKMSWDTMCLQNLRIGPVQSTIIGDQLTEVFPGFSQKSDIAEVNRGNIVLDEDWKKFQQVNLGTEDFDVQLRAYYDRDQNILFICDWEVFDPEGDNVRHISK